MINGHSTLYMSPEETVEGTVDLFLDLSEIPLFLAVKLNL